MAEQPTVIVVPTTAGAYIPPTEEKRGLSTGAKLVLLLILLGALGVLGYLIVTGWILPGQDCTNMRKPAYQFCIGNERKVIGSKNCCRCPTLFGDSDIYECGHG